MPVGSATDKASDKAWLLVGLLEHMLEHHGVQELVRRGCPPPLIGALSEYVAIGECDAGWPAFQAVIEQLT